MNTPVDEGDGSLLPEDGDEHQVINVVTDAKWREAVASSSEVRREAGISAMAVSSEVEAMAASSSEAVVASSEVAAVSMKAVAASSGETIDSGERLRAVGRKAQAMAESGGHAAESGGREAKSGGHAAESGGRAVHEAQPFPQQLEWSTGRAVFGRVSEGSPVMVQKTAGSPGNEGETSIERKTRLTYTSLPPISRVPMLSAVKGKLISAGYTSLTSISLSSTNDLARDVDVTEAEAIEIWKIANQIIGSEKSKMVEESILDPVRRGDGLESERVQHDLSLDTLKKNEHGEISEKESPQTGDNEGIVQVPALQGAWAKKPNLTNASGSVWPSPAETRVVHNLQEKRPKVFKPIAMEDNERFPWAAKMNPASRNLYRASEPEYLDDGTPKVTIPPEVMLQGIENQERYILGQFYRCSPPPGGLIHAVFNKLWGRKCRITIKKVSETTYLFHIPDKSSRNWVLQRGIWHVDDCLMFVAPWNAEVSLDIPEIKTIPVWVTLKKIPNILYSIPGISNIASGLGAPMATHKPWLDPSMMGEAKIMVEVELSKAFPSRIAASDKSGFVAMVDVEYAWLPTKCTRCGQLGHKVKRCLQIEKNSLVKVIEASKQLETENISADQRTGSGCEANEEVLNSQTTRKVDNTTIFLETSKAAIVESNKNPATATQTTLSPTTNVLEKSHVQSKAIIVSASRNSQGTENEDQGIEGSTHTTKLKLADSNLRSNKFAFLSYSEGEDLDSESEDSGREKDSDPNDLLTPFGKRILRDRPVKPSVKAIETQSLGQGRGGRGRRRGRGNKGRGNGGGRG